MWPTFVPVFPPGTRAEKALLASDQSQLSGRHFFGVTVFTPSRFFSAATFWEAAPGCKGGSPGTTPEASLHLLLG
jgi:hypothetical protein